MIIWEYKIVVDDISEYLLNKYGAQGWELVCYDSGGVYADKLIFKRPKKE